MSQARLRRYFRHGTLPQLMVFHTIVQLGSFTAAAEALHLAQPTVSLHMKKLADTIGAPLFRQEGRGQRLTSAGRELARTCAELMEAFAGLDARLAAPDPAGGAGGAAAAPACYRARPFFCRPAARPERRPRSRKRAFDAS